MSGIITCLCHDDVERRIHVLIEAPPGRGKSALVRAIVERMLNRFERDPSLPLPVLCPKGGSEMTEILKGELGRDGYSEAAIRMQLRHGLFVLVADAIDESVWTADDLKRIVSGNYEHTMVLAATRPSSARHEAFAYARQWLWAEPLPLNEGTLALFEQDYLVADVRAGLLSRRLDSSLRKLCEIGQGLYSPLLVRFAMRLSNTKVANVFELYKQVIQRMLNPRASDMMDRLLRDAGAFCVKTYWATGRRELSEAQLAKGGEIVATLRRAHVLVLASSGPDILRFFHASAQSFLTALGLAENADGDVLARAAGEPSFYQEHSDLLGRAGSDLYYFLIHALGPPEACRMLTRQLRIWQKEIGNDLPRSIIERACPAEYRATLSQWIIVHAHECSNERIFSALLDALSRLPEARQCAAIVEIFAALAPSVSEMAQRPRQANANAPSFPTTHAR
ncbi:hypothetical protein [Nannocystis pusilla]|uniref:hypothetical protein n=1 Tax=Nannocystis pusilla TaxID=889268 RepID=UPI003B7A5AFF